MDNWDKVLDGVSKIDPLVTYDRPGDGKSPSDNIDVLAEMRKSDFKEIRNSKLPNIPVHILFGGLLGYSPTIQVNRI